MGSTWQSFHIICHWWSEIGFSKTPTRIGLFWNLENLYCPGGWVGGWVGCDQKCPWICLIFGYIDKKDVYFINIWKKVVTNFLMGFKIWDEFGGRGHQFLKIPYLDDFSNFCSWSTFSRSLFRFFFNMNKTGTNFSYFFLNLAFPIRKKVTNFKLKTDYPLGKMLKKTVFQKISPWEWRFSTFPSAKSKIRRNFQKQIVGKKNGFKMRKVQKNITSKNELHLALSPIVFEIWAIL